jgi:hypothetical protein
VLLYRKQPHLAINILCFKRTTYDILFFSQMHHVLNLVVLKTFITTHVYGFIYNIKPHPPFQQNNFMNPFIIIVQLSNFPNNVWRLIVLLSEVVSNLL